MDETKIQLLVDRAEISDLLIRYTTCLDTKDWELLHSCFTDEVEIDFSSIGIPMPTTTKVDNFIAFLNKSDILLTPIASDIYSELVNSHIEVPNAVNR